jgi:hydrogenase-4 component B
MLSLIASLTGFTVLLSLFGLGIIGALAGHAHDKFANIWSGTCAAVASLWGLIFAAELLITGHEITFKTALSNFTFFSLSLHIDKMAAFFILVICLIAFFCSLYGMGYVKEYYKRYNIGQLGAFYNLFIIGMLLVVTAANGIWFLMAWEIMSLASYFLVVYDRNSAQNVRAGYVYLVMTHVGAACILLAFAMLFTYTHSFDFDVIQTNFQAVPQLVQGAVFILALVGLGTKAGIIPLHIWLPLAHPAAPSHVSALMSGVMIKTGIYMMVRLFLGIMQPLPVWWGVVVLVLGAISALVGVLYALTEHDIKRLLAYHSIENIGIILLGLGSAMVFAATNQPLLESLALAAALFHTLNHAIFKSLLFLSAGSIIQATHTRNIEEYGGLLKLMPLTGLFFLVGSMAISALPPFNGFFSEWITYQSLFSGLAAGGATKWAFLFAAASLAVTGGLALACFVKAFGVTFLARPRSASAAHASEPSAVMRISMAGLTALCLVVGLCAGPIVAVLQNVGRQLITLVVPQTSVGQTLAVTAGSGAHVSSVSGIVLALLLLSAAAVVWLIVRYGVNRQQKVRVGPTWDCGTPLTGRMEITSTSFARSIILIFGRFLRPDLKHHAEYDSYAVKSRSVILSVRDVYLAHLYAPAYRGLLALSTRAKRIQNGNLNAYILYILVVLASVLLIGAF